MADRRLSPSLQYRTIQRHKFERSVGSSGHRIGVGDSSSNGGHLVQVRRCQSSPFSAREKEAIDNVETIDKHSPTPLPSNRTSHCSPLPTFSICMFLPSSRSCSGICPPLFDLPSGTRRPKSIRSTEASEPWCAVSESKFTTVVTVLRYVLEPFSGSLCCPAVAEIDVAMKVVSPRPRGVRGASVVAVASKELLLPPTDGDSPSR